MTRAEVERKLIDKLEEIVEIYHEYHPYGKYLGMYYINDSVSVNNLYFDEDSHKPVDARRHNAGEHEWSERIDGKYTFWNEVSEQESNN